MLGQDNTLVVSGYWKVDDNPKPTNGRHIAGAAKKRIDLFFSYQDHGFPWNESQSEYFYMSNPPSSEYAESWKSRECPCFTKYSIPADWKSFSQLGCIWLGKVKLLAKARELYPGKDYYVWGDMCYRRDEWAIMRSKSDKVLFTVNNWPEWPPYGGLLNAHKGIERYRQLPVIVSGSFLKIPDKSFDEFYDKFHQILEYVNNDYFIYDEEIVMSEMLMSYPKMFERTHNPKGMPCFSS